VLDLFIWASASLLGGLQGDMGQHVVESATKTRNGQEHLMIIDPTNAGGSHCFTQVWAPTPKETCNSSGMIQIPCLKIEIDLLHSQNDNRFAKFCQ
jgi:hypothetical protein